MRPEIGNLWIGFAGLCVVVIGALITFLRTQSANDAKNDVKISHLELTIAKVEDDAESKEKEMHRRLNQHDDRLRSVETAIAVVSIHNEPGTVKFSPRHQSGDQAS